MTLALRPEDLRLESQGDWQVDFTLFNGSKLNNSIEQNDLVAKAGFFDRWLPAIILCLIAGIQLYLANFRGLSPWKGGGFGMFATVDAPPMRFVTAEGLDQDGNLVRIDAEDIMSESDLLRWTSWPDEVLLRRLADRIFSLRYLQSGSQRRQAIENLRGENPQIQLPENEDLSNWMRPVRAGDPENKATFLKAIRVEGWRMVYDKKANKLVTEPLGSPIEWGDWP